MESAVDFATVGAPRLTFERSYTSNTVFMNGVFSATRLGKGWRSSYDSGASYVGASPTTPTLVDIALPDGAEVAFVPNAGQFSLAYYNTSDNGWHAGRQGFDARLVRNDALSLYQLTLTDDTVYTYDYNGRLVSIARRGGYTQTLSYDANGNNTSVADSLGRTLTFTYSSQGLLNTLTAPDGSVTQFSYLGRYDPQVFAGVDPTTIDKSFWALQTWGLPLPG